MRKTDSSPEAFATRAKPDTYSNLVAKKAIKESVADSTLA